jgi:hypothetical protein
MMENFIPPLHSNSSAYYLVSLYCGNESQSKTLHICGTNCNLHTCYICACDENIQAIKCKDKAIPVLK